MAVSVTTLVAISEQRCQLIALLCDSKTQEIGKETELWMLEPEAAVVELEEAMELAECLVSAIVARVLKNRARELETLKRDSTKLANVKPVFPRISYEDAVAVLNRGGNPVKFR